jgi:hypothetical protein
LVGLAFDLLGSRGDRWNLISLCASSDISAAGAAARREPFMKRLLLITCVSAVLGGATGAWAVSDTTKGAAAGAVGGAVVAGPVGAVAGGVGGAVVGHHYGKHHHRHYRHHD